MDIREFRALTDKALCDVGLEEYRLPRVPRPIKAWSMPGTNLTRFFSPHAYRRPWGFVFSGFIGIEIPDLRRWLKRNKPGEEIGVFHACFVGYDILNDDALSGFMVEHDEHVPANLWAKAIVDRLESIPSSIEEAMLIYRSKRENLGWLANPGSKPMWDFLQAWLQNPDPDLHVPRMSPTGQIT